MKSNVASSYPFQIYAHSSFIEGSHTTKNTASALIRETQSWPTQLFDEKSATRKVGKLTVGQKCESFKKNFNSNEF
jgi:hypothetical protein